MNDKSQRQPGNRWLHGNTDDVRRIPNENQGRRNQRQREFNPQRNVFGAAPRRRNTLLEGA